MKQWVQVNHCQRQIIIWSGDSIICCYPNRKESYIAGQGVQLSRLRQRAVNGINPRRKLYGFFELCRGGNWDWITAQLGLNIDFLTASSLETVCRV